MQGQKSVGNTITMKVTKAEKSILTTMALEQNMQMEKLVRDLIFKSGLIALEAPGSTRKSGSMSI